MGHQEILNLTMVSASRTRNRTESWRVQLCSLSDGSTELTVYANMREEPRVKVVCYNLVPSQVHVNGTWTTRPLLFGSGV